MAIAREWQGRCGAERGYHRGKRQVELVALRQVARRDNLCARPPAERGLVSSQRDETHPYAIG
jgi:hypothetical protein